MSWTDALLVIAVGFAAGFINVVAGGGSLSLVKTVKNTP